MTDFDPVRAQREILAGLADVHRVILSRSREAERQFAEAEANAGALMKIERFAAQQVTEARAKLKALEEAAERAASGAQE